MLNKEHREYDLDIPQTNLLENKVAVVTGASRGIGRAIAEAFAYHGARAVVINSTEKSQAEAEDVLRVISGYESETLWVPGRLEEEETRQRLIEETVERFDSLHILVNNAGITKDNLFLRLRPADLDTVMDINFRSAFFLTQMAAEYMLSEGDGSVIFMSSIAAHGNPGQANYAASKAALEALAKSLAVEYGSMGLRFNAIAPALVDTEMAAGLSADQRDALIRQTPLGRIITTSEVANVALFLASDLSRGVNGQVIPADGGACR